MNVKQLNIELSDSQKAMIRSIFDTAKEESYDDSKENLIDYLVYELIEMDDLFDDAIEMLEYWGF